MDELYVAYAVVNDGSALWRYRAAALGRVSPIRKRTSHVEIRVAKKEE